MEMFYGIKVLQLDIIVFLEDQYRPSLPGGLYINAVYIDVSIRKGNCVWYGTLCTLTFPLNDKTKKVTLRPAKTQISLGISPVLSESSLCAQWVAQDPSFLHADSEDSDQTGRMPRLIWVFAGRTATLLVLSCRGSNICAVQRH